MQLDHPYKVVSLDMAAARTNYELQAPEGMLVAQVVPAPFTVRLGRTSADAITVRQPGKIASCNAIGAVFISHAAATGTLELIFAPADFDIDFFSGAGASAVWETIAHIVPATSVGTGGYGLNLIGVSAGLVTLMNVASSLATAYDATANALWCTQITDGGSADHRVAVQAANYELGIPNLLEPDGIARIRRRFGSWRLTDGVLIASTAVADARAYWGMYGVAHAGGLLTAWGFGFRFTNASPNWFAHIGRYNGGGVGTDPIEYNQNTGVSATAAVRFLELRFGGNAAGTATIEWYIDDVLVGSFTGLMSTDFASSVRIAPMFGAWALNSGQQVRISYHMLGGLRLERKRDVIA